MSKEIREQIDRIKNWKQFLNEQDTGIIKIYHGVPFKNSADGIKKNGLQQVGDFVPVGGDGSPSIGNRSYVAKELWNAIRYSFMKPNSINMEWNEYIKKLDIYVINDRFCEQSTKREKIPNPIEHLKRTLSDGRAPVYQHGTTAILVKQTCSTLIVLQKEYKMLDYAKR